MRIRALEITNFKALSHLQLDDIADAVVLAGPNGCGKSCVLDAIRLLKSAYGGYQPNEWHSWFGEFQINFNQRPEELLKLFQDTSRGLSINATFSFRESEIEFLARNATELLREAAWRELVPELAAWRSFATTSLTAQYRTHHDQVERIAAEARDELMIELESGAVRASVSIDTTGRISTEPSRLLELAFSSYDPHDVGILEFHSPNRQYNREVVGGVNLDVTGAETQKRQNALYNPQNKYAGLKSEMASVYVRRTLAEVAGADSADETDLVAALQDLFATFFPGKSFLGPQPTEDGRIEFPVQLADGSTHDLDDLSSGEKEVLYGYMRLRNTAPRNSVILLDEPELHLNPRLVQGLARFYYNHLVAGYDNQLWLITHSDALLRDAVSQDGFDVYHMKPGSRTEPTENQVASITTAAETDRLVIELVGDLAAYRPGAKVVLFEGGGDVEFDVRMVARLFPEFDGAVNAIAAGNKRQVTALHETLEGIGSAALGARFYAIRDRDSAPREEEGARLYTWDAYHIENYLLEPEYVLRAISELSQADTTLTDANAVEAALRDCAAETVGPLVRHEMISWADQELRRALRLGGDPGAESVSDVLRSTIDSSVERVAEVGATDLSLDALREREAELREQFAEHLTSDEWRRTYRGRDVLGRFVSQHVGGSNYETLRDLIVARMKEADFQPAGMREVLSAIVEDTFP